MNQVLNGCLGIFCYLDDILIAVNDKDTQRQILQVIKEKLKTNNISVNHGNSTDYRQVVYLLVYTLSPSELKPIKEKLRL